MEQYIEVKAIFIGQDGSLGYRQRRTYYLLLNITNGKVCIKPRDVDRIEAKPCTYDRLKLFLDNWEVID